MAAVGYVDGKKSLLRMPPVKEFDFRWCTGAGAEQDAVVNLVPGYGLTKSRVTRATLRFFFRHKDDCMDDGDIFFLPFFLTRNV